MAHMASDLRLPQTTGRLSRADPVSQFETKPTESNTTAWQEFQNPESLVAALEQAPAGAKRHGPVPGSGVFAGKKRLVFAGRTGGDTTPNSTPKGLAKAKRKAVAKILVGPDQKPLEVILENMLWRMQKARSLEAMAGDVLPAGELAEILALRAAASEDASRAAPYIHARLAPIVPKGETGLTVNLVIEEA